MIHDADYILIAITSFEIKAIGVALVLIHFVVKMLTGIVIILTRWKEISTSTVCHNILAEYNPVRHGFSFIFRCKDTTNSPYNQSNQY